TYTAPGAEAVPVSLAIGSGDLAALGVDAAGDPGLGDGANLLQLDPHLDRWFDFSGAAVDLAALGGGPITLKAGAPGAAAPVFAVVSDHGAGAARFAVTHGAAPAGAELVWVDFDGPTLLKNRGGDLYPSFYQSEGDGTMALASDDAVSGNALVAT